MLFMTPRMGPFAEQKQLPGAKCEVYLDLNVAGCCFLRSSPTGFALYF